jgi:hypothetical protein
MLFLIYMLCFNTLPSSLLYMIDFEYLGIAFAVAILALYIIVLYFIIIGLLIALFILLTLFIIIVIIDDIKLI